MPSGIDLEGVSRSAEVVTKDDTTEDIAAPARSTEDITHVDKDAPPAVEDSVIATPESGQGKGKAPGKIKGKGKSSDGTKGKSTGTDQASVSVLNSTTASLDDTSTAAAGTAAGPPAAVTKPIPS